MPTYTYRCNSCEYQFDIRQRMADDPLTDCPTCETENGLRKVLNSVGIVFKGSGFYVTDNRGKKNGASASANGKDSETSSSAKPEGKATEKGSGKTDSKADAGSTKKKASKTAA